MAFYSVIVSSGKVARVAVRTINRFDWTSEAINLNDYFNGIPSLPNPFSNLQQFNFQYMLSNGLEDEIQAGLKIASLPTVAQDALSMVFDTDVFKLGEFNP